MVPDSVTAWKMTCGWRCWAVLVSAMEISAGLRTAEGRERIRVRRAFPRSQAVLAVKEGKMTAGESSKAMSSSICFIYIYQP
jgi:hypothetical protein